MLEILQFLVKHAATLMVVSFSIMLSVWVLSSPRLRRNINDAHEEGTKTSWTRYMGTLVIITAIIVMFAQIIQPNTEPDSTLIVGLIGVALVGKAFSGLGGGSSYTYRPPYEDDEMMKY